MENAAVIGRFAPTPSGEMHVGNLFCALIAYLSAKSKGGKFLIRIEDVDFCRCPRGAAEEIIRTLARFGVESDEPIVYQSERTAAYEEAERLLRSRAEVYPCYCSRARLHGESAVRLADGGILYDGRCRRLTDAERAAMTVPPSYRIHVPDETITFVDGIAGEQSQNLARECGDFIIKRSDGVYPYRLAAVTDDGYSGVTEVVRGADLLYDTVRQIWLQRLLGLPTPKYYHIPLVLASSGRKLSKSAGDGAAPAARKLSPERVIGALAHAAGLTESDRPISARELVALYDPKKIAKSIVLPDYLTE